MDEGLALLHPGAVFEGNDGPDNQGVGFQLASVVGHDGDGAVLATAPQKNVSPGPGRGILGTHEKDTGEESHSNAKIAAGK